MNSVFERIGVQYADICDLAVDAIVNPAHRDLLGGGGLDGMIHDAAGPELLSACEMLDGCDVGDAKITPGFALPAKWVIHTVGPVWRGGGEEEDRLLASCYHRCLEEAVAVGAESVAFPGLSTGLHRFPIRRAAAIATNEVARFLNGSPTPRSVHFVCFDNASLVAYQALIRRD